MKIYASDKEKIKKIVHMEYQQETMPTHLFNYGTEDVEVQSLEQHEAEIRKQVLQELKEDYGGIDYGITSKKYKLTNFDCDITKPLKQIIREKIKDARKPLKDEIELLKNDIVNYKADIENLKDQSFGVGRIKYLEKELEVYKMAFNKISSGFLSQTIDGKDYCDIIGLWKLDNDIDTFGTSSEDLKQYFLEQARKELINDKTN